MVKGAVGCRSLVELGWASSLPLASRHAACPALRPPNTAESEAVAGSVPDSGGVYFVPAFGGLLAPWWQDDARGVIVGLTQYSTKVGGTGRWRYPVRGGGQCGCRRRGSAMPSFYFPYARPPPA